MNDFYGYSFFNETQEPFKTFNRVVVINNIIDREFLIVSHGRHWKPWDNVNSPKK